MNTENTCLEVAKFVFDTITATATIVLSLCVLYFTRQQTRLAKIQTKVAAFERRIVVYDAIRAFLAHITETAAVRDEKLVTMLRETKYAEFLFPRHSKISSLIDELYRHGVELEYIVKAYRGVPPNWNDLVAKQNELLEWFKTRGAEIQDQFRPYLALEDD